MYFVTVARSLGYRKTISLIGRHFREFIYNLDNAHDYFKLQFPAMNAPSFFVSDEHQNG